MANVAIEEFCTSLASRTGDPDGQVVQTLGHSSRGDGGGGQFYLDTSDTTTAINNGTVFAAVSGRWKRIFSGPVHLKWFGAKGNADTDPLSNDTNAWNSFLGVLQPGQEGYAEKGEYRITSPLVVNTPQISVRATSADMDGGGCRLRWAGTDANKFLVTLTTYGVVFDGVNLAAETPLLGGYNLAATTASAGGFQSQCTVKNCTVLSGPSLNDNEIRIGCAVGYFGEAFNNQEFNRFENVRCLNMMEDGFHIAGQANTIGTLFIRCTAGNYMGSPGNKMYQRRVSDGTISDDGKFHPYGRGFYNHSGSEFLLEDCNFHYLETGIRIDGNAFTYLKVDGLDSEHCKKLLYGHPNTGPLSNYVIRNIRAATTVIDTQSIGPDGNNGKGYPTSDVKYIDTQGPNLLLDTCNISLVDNNTRQIPNCIRCAAINPRSKLIAVNSSFPSVTPFTSDTRYACIGCLGSNGNGTSQDVSTAIIDQNSNHRGTATITGSAGGTSKTVAVLFPVWNLREQEFTPYNVLVTPVSYTGTPASNSMIATAASKTLDGFTITAQADPGSGNSVTFYWQVVP